MLLPLQDHDRAPAGGGQTTHIAVLSPCARWVFVATNVAYFMASAMLFVHDPIADPLAACLTSQCSAAALHGALVLFLAVVSSYWHAVQCRLVPCAASLHGSSACNKGLLLSDITCSLTTVGVGVACFGPARTFSWLGPSIGFFVFGAVAKRRQHYAAYAIAHGAWHALSALAIVKIVLSGSPLVF